MLCNDVYCTKENGKLENLTNLSMKFEDFNVEFTPEEYLYLD